MYNYLTINGQGFRPPNSVLPQSLEVSYHKKWDGMDGMTNFHKIIAGTKTGYLLTFTYLNRFEFEFLESMRNVGSISVSHDLTGFGFSGNYFIDFPAPEFGLAGGRNNVLVTLTPENID